MSDCGAYLQGRGDRLLTFVWATVFPQHRWRSPRGFLRLCQPVCTSTYRTLGRPVVGRIVYKSRELPQVLGVVPMVFPTPSLYEGVRTVYQPHHGGQTSIADFVEVGGSVACRIAHYRAYFFSCGELWVRMIGADIRSVKFAEVVSGDTSPPALTWRYSERK